MVTDTVAEPRTFARFDGEPVVGFSILRAKGASDVRVAERSWPTRSKRSRSQYPDVDLKLIDSSVDLHAAATTNPRMHTLYEGAALAVIVVFLFLRDVRATIIAAIALPLSILPAFWAMDVLGFSLNLVSLLAITLSTGILVDDAIVEIENIVRHIRMGKSPYEASIEAADEIGLAVIAISLTIVAVFVPASFMSVDRRPVLQAVRHHGVGAGAVLAAVRAPDHADAGGLFPQAACTRRRSAPGA